MRFKIDENLPIDVAFFLREAGYDAVTVIDENLGGSTDLKLIEVCRSERRILMSLDMDFSDIRTYPPRDYPGIVVFRLSSQDKTRILDLVGQVVNFAKIETIENRLLIVEEERIRIRE